MSRAEPTQRQERNDEELDFDEADELNTANGRIYDKVYEVAEKFAGTYIGQFTTGKLDQVLKLIEDTAKWSLPQSSQEKNDSNTPLERPLPWIPFIGMILLLRTVRLSLSIGGLFIGNAPLAPGDVVYFIQTRRRKLRAIRIVGMRDIRKKEQAKGQKGNSGIVSKLRSLLSVVVCRPGQGKEVPQRSSVNQNNREGANNSAAYEAKNDCSSSKRRRAKEEDASDHDLTLDQIIDKYGGASSDNDSDFIPPNEALNDEETSSQSTSSAPSEDDDDDNDVKQPMEDASPESDAHMTNGNRRSQNPSSFTENLIDDNSMLIKENGEYFSKASRKPVTMPKPRKAEPVPTPFQEIKQEPLDSDEDRSSRQKLQEDPREFKRTNEQSQHQQQQSIVAHNDEKINDYETAKDKVIADGAIEQGDKKLNGGECVPVIDNKSEVFLTPATSTEDLFFSPVGSPNLSGSFGFQPTSILKNSNSVHLEKRGPAVINSNDDNTKAEAAETYATTKPINTSLQPAKGGGHYTGKHNKNKFRGKRR